VGRKFGLVLVWLAREHGHRAVLWYSVRRVRSWMFEKGACCELDRHAGVVRLLGLCKGIIIIVLVKSSPSGYSTLPGIMSLADYVADAYRSIEKT
jgi:hypothetical protein